MADDKSDEVSLQNFKLWKTEQLRDYLRKRGLPARKNRQVWFTNMLLLNIVLNILNLLCLGTRSSVLFGWNDGGTC